MTDLPKVAFWNFQLNLPDKVRVATYGKAVVLSCQAQGVWHPVHASRTALLTQRLLVFSATTAQNFLYVTLIAFFMQVASGVYRFSLHDW